MVDFNFSYAPGTTLQQMIGFETAGRVWSSYLSDPVTVNLYVGVSSSLPTNVIGGALPGIRAAQQYRDVLIGLQKDATSADDRSALASLPTGFIYQGWFDSFNLASGQNTGQIAQTATLNLTSANAKALGISSGNTSNLDGVILFGALTGANYTWSYDFTRSSSAPAGTLDFLSTAMHEIGHILGFVSGVDKPGWLNSKAGGVESAQYSVSLLDRVTYTTPLDFFRYSTVTRTGINDLSYGSVGANKFFSVDDGKTAIAQFSTGTDRTLGGDGFQASHWKNSTTRTGIMAPALSPEERSRISTADLRAFDVIGWTLTPLALGGNVDLSSLQSQATTAIAQRLNVTTTWLSQNAATAAQRLGQDRSADVNLMIQNSQIYPWSSKPTGNSGTPANPFRQVFDLLSTQVVYSNFDTLDPEFSLAPATQTAASELPKLDFSGLDRLANSPLLNLVKTGILDLGGIAPKSIETTPIASIESVDLQKWFDQLEQSLRKGSGKSKPNSNQSDQKSRRFTDWTSVDWTNF